MSELEKIVALDKLLEIMAQLRVTLNRLIFRYVSGRQENEA